MNPRLASLLADGVLVAHALFVGFVVVGQLVILGALALRRGWARSWRLRLVHLLCVAFVVVQTWLGLTCPLTVWEHTLRLRAGQAGYSEGFVATWLQRLIFYEAEPRIFVWLYTAFGGAVVVTWVLAPPRRR